MATGILRTALVGLAGAAFVAAGVAADGKKGDKAKANDGVVTNWGEPKGFGPGKANAYWLWYDDGVWHFRTTGGGKGSPRFTGRVDVVGGKFTGIKGKAGEYRGKNVDRYVFNAAGTALAFDFNTDEGSDGLNFAVDPGADGLKFTLAINGDAAPKHIHLGRDGDHPDAAVFTVPAHPADPPAAKGKKKK